MGYPVVMGASPGRPGEAGTREASGCSVIVTTGLFLLRISNGDSFSPVKVCFPGEVDNQQIDNQ